MIRQGWIWNKGDKLNLLMDLCNEITLIIHEGSVLDQVQSALQVLKDFNNLNLLIMIDHSVELQRLLAQLPRSYNRVTLDSDSLILLDLVYDSKEVALTSVEIDEQTLVPYFVAKTEALLLRGCNIKNISLLSFPELKHLSFYGGVFEFGVLRCFDPEKLLTIKLGNYINQDVLDFIGELPNLKQAGIQVYSPKFVPKFKNTLEELSLDMIDW